MISAAESDELVAALKLYDSAATQIRRAINADTRARAPEIRRLVARQAVYPLDRRAAKSVKVSAGQQLKVTMGSTGTLPKSRTRLKTIVREAVEFGSNRRKEMTYVGPVFGRSVEMTRHTQKQLVPRNEKGRMFYPAVTRWGPDLVAGWVFCVASHFDPVNVRR